MLKKSITLPLRIRKYEESKEAWQRNKYPTNKQQLLQPTFVGMAIISKIEKAKNYFVKFTATKSANNNKKQPNTKKRKEKKKSQIKKYKLKNQKICKTNLTFKRERIRTAKRIGAVRKRENRNPPSIGS